MQRERGQASIPHLFWPACVFPLTVRVSAKQTEICKNWVAVDVTDRTMLTVVQGTSWRLVPCGQGLLTPLHPVYLEHVAECCLFL